MTAQPAKSRVGLPLRFPVMLGFLALMLGVMEVGIHQLGDGINQRLYQSARLEETSKLDMESERLFRSADRFAHGIGGQKKDDVLLALDLVWARVQTLRTKNYKAVLPAEQTDNLLIEDINTALPDFDKAVAKLEAGNPDSINELRRLEMRFSERLSKLGDLAWTVRQQKMEQLAANNLQSVRRLREIQTGFAIFAIFGIAYVIVELVLSRRLNRRLNTVLAEKQQLLKTDPLTNIGNRASFEEALATAGARPMRDFSVIYLDLDGFKQVNDSQGHASGDRLLVDIARILTDLAMPIDTIARLGGDEFAMILPGSRSRAETYSRRALGMINRTFGHGNGAPIVSGSMGVSHTKDLEAGADIQMLMRYADMALYAAKADGKNCIRHFSQSILADHQCNAALEADLRTAIADGTLSTAFQPIVRIEDERVVAAEALVRWNHPALGAIPADRIIEIAARTDQMTALTFCVLGQAIAMQQELVVNGRGMRISVNLCPSLLGKPGMAEQIIAFLAERQAQPGTIALEVTENGPLDCGGIVDVNLKTLREAGVVMAIDDFGEAHSNINRLMQLDFRYLKIDRAIAANLASSDRAVRILTGISRMAETIGTHIICEGIETAEQLALVREAGITLGQGFLFSKPLARADFLTHLVEHDLVALNTTLLRRTSGTLAQDRLAM